MSFNTKDNSFLDGAEEPVFIYIQYILDACAAPLILPAYSEDTFVMSYLLSYLIPESAFMIQNWMMMAGEAICKGFIVTGGVFQIIALHH